MRRDSARALRATLPVLPYRARPPVLPLLDTEDRDCTSRKGIVPYAARA
jgi:hypothetical protein